MILFGFIFIQYFSTMPLYYAQSFKMSEFEIGLLLGMNGFLIFLLEMPLIKYLEGRKFNPISLMVWGTALVGISFLLVNLSGLIGILIVGMIFLTIGEMIAFPFSNTFALKRAERGKQGSYMALYSIAFSISHIFGHNSGMQLIENFGYEFTWYTMVFLAILACALLVWLKITMRKEANSSPPN